MSLQAYYDDFRTGHWADPDASRCPCHGSGWALSDVDTWHECPCHYAGQQHPEDWSPDEVALMPSPPIPVVPYVPCTDDDIPF